MAVVQTEACTTSCACLARTLDAPGAGTQDRQRHHREEAFHRAEVHPRKACLVGALRTEGQGQLAARHCLFVMDRALVKSMQNRAVSCYSVYCGVSTNRTH